MRIRWRGLELPSQVIRDESVSTETYGRFIIEPFERGFGTTIGNSLRRVLLSSLEGAAVTHMRLAGVDHEFTPIAGVYEDVTDIVLNIKGIIVRLEVPGPRKMRLLRETPGEIKAGDFECEPGLTVVNPDHHIATLTDAVRFELELTVNTGRGYATAEENEGPEQVHGIIPLDSVFSPVTRVRYKTEDTRVGQRIDYDRLILEIWTNGTIRPEDALVEAAKILRKHLNPFVAYHHLGDELSDTAPALHGPEEEMDEELRAKLATPIQELDLSVRARNCLLSDKIYTLGDLIRKTEADLLSIRSFGQTSLREVKRKLEELGLSLAGEEPRGEEAQTASSPADAPGDSPQSSETVSTGGPSEN